MRRTYYNKLIRDLIPAIIEEDNGIPTLSLLTDEAFLLSLKEKLVEEATEASKAADAQELLKELADVLEVIDSLAAAYDIPLEDIRAFQAKKRAARGGFEKKIFLSYVDKMAKK